MSQTNSLTEDAAQGGRGGTGSRTRQMVTASLVASLVAASAWVQIPVQPVPITLQVFFVVLAALLLAPEWAFGSMAVYLGLGAIGVPVFSGGHGGIGVLAGPTGGYLYGFIAAAGLGSSVRVLLSGTRMNALIVDAVSATVVILVIYTVGAAHLAMVLGLSAPKAIAAGVAPFIVPDGLKAAAAVIVAAAVRRAVR